MFSRSVQYYNFLEFLKFIFAHTVIFEGQSKVHGMNVLPDFRHLFGEGGYFKGKKIEYVNSGDGEQCTFNILVNNNYHHYNNYVYL